jgi:hypothetical protein
MNTIVLFPWLEWEEARPLIDAAVRREGFPSLTAYAGSLPQADLLDLSCLLAIARVHSGQLQRRLWEEAAEAGNVARCARDLLVRALCVRLGAWRQSGGSRARYLEDAFYAWREQLPENVRHVEDEIRSAMLAVEPPADWVPEHADDSILVSLFAQHWPDEAEREPASEALASGLPATATPTKPGRATPSIAFERAMTCVDTRCRQLTILLDLGDLDSVEPVARSAVNLWLAGSSAYRRLARHDEPTVTEVKSIRQRLDAMYLRLLNGLKRACSLLERHPSRNTFDDLWMELVTAAAQLDSDARPRAASMAGLHNVS